MKVIIGYGNSLRGEDGFGIEVIEKLRTFSDLQIKLITVYSLTPELSLELLDADEIIFIDACYDAEHSYVFACSLLRQIPKFSHHMEPQLLISILKNLYDRDIDFSIYSMLTNNFDTIFDLSAYTKSIDDLAYYLVAHTHGGL